MWVWGGLGLGIIEWIETNNRDGAFCMSRSNRITMPPRTCEAILLLLTADQGHRNGGGC